MSRASTPPPPPLRVHVQSSARRSLMRGVTIGPHRPHRVIVGLPTTKTGGGAHHRLRAVSAELGLSGGNGGIMSAAASPPRGLGPKHDALISCGMWRPRKHTMVGGGAEGNARFFFAKKNKKQSGPRHHFTSHLRFLPFDERETPRHQPNDNDAQTNTAPHHHSLSWTDNVKM